MEKNNLLNKTNDLSETVMLIDLILVIAKQIKIIILFPLGFCLLTVLYVLLFANPKYTSKAKIMSSTGSKQSQVFGIASQFGIDIPSGQSDPKWAYEEILKSRTISKALLKKKIQHDGVSNEISLFEVLSDKSDDNILTQKTRMVDKLLKMIKVSKNIKTGIYDVRVTATNPALSYEINRALIEELDNHLQNYNKEKTGETRKFIEERIIDTEKELMEAEENLKNFMDSNRRIDNSPALKLEMQRLAREVTVLTGVFTTLKQQRETTKIEEVKESDYVVIVDPPEVPLKQSSPDFLLYLFLNGSIGLFMGLISAFFNEYLENKSDEDKNKISYFKKTIFKNLSDLLPF